MLTTLIATVALAWGTILNLSLPLGRPLFPVRPYLIVWAISDILLIWSLFYLSPKIYSFMTA